MGIIELSFLLTITLLSLLQLVIIFLYGKKHHRSDFNKTKIFWVDNYNIPIIILLMAVTFYFRDDSYPYLFLILSGYFYIDAYKITFEYEGETISTKYPLFMYIKDCKDWTTEYYLDSSFFELLLDIVWYIWAAIKQNLKHNWNEIKFIFNPSFTENSLLSSIVEPLRECHRIYYRHKVTKTEKELEKENFENFKRLPENLLTFFKPMKDYKFPVYLIVSDIEQKLMTQHFLLFYNFIKTTLIAICASLLYFIYTIFFFKLQFLKQIAVWFVVGMLFFWLLSGFNFFLKRYQYGKFTSSIQRFWKRTNTCFWLIEGFLILIFFYYYINSSQEPVYMYDYSSLNQEYLVSLQTAGVNVILLSVIIYFMYFTLLRINSSNVIQINLYLMVISIFIFFSFFIETYQFYYVINSFNERLWVFNEEENLWLLDQESPTLRTKNQYLLVCLIAKYWHFLFIFISWVFFLIKSLERRKVTYTLFGANLQNIVLLYVLNFACYLQWFKWVYHRFLELPYNWFMTNIDTKLIFRFFHEIWLLIVSLFNLNSITSRFNTPTYKSLNYWLVDSLAIWKFI